MGEITIYDSDKSNNGMIEDNGVKEIQVRIEVTNLDNKQSALYMAYYDNNAARHFMAQYSIFPEIAMESPHKSQTFSNQIENVVLCSLKPIKDDIFTENDGKYQVVFEIDLEKLPEQQIAMIQDAAIKQVKLDEYINSKDKASTIALCSLIPFEAVSGILLKSEEDKRNFIDPALSNIPFKQLEDRIIVKPEVFDGDKLILPENKVDDLTKSFDINYKNIRHINHMRAALLASLQSSKFPISKSIVTSYDKKMISILANCVGHKDADKQYDSLAEKANRQFIAGGFKCALNILDEDKTPISEFNWLIKQLQSLKMDKPHEPDFFDGLNENEKNEEELIDAYTFRKICWLFIEVENNYKPQSMIESFSKEFVNDLEKWNQPEKPNMVDLVEKYIVLIEKLRKNLEGTSTPSSSSKQKSYPTLTALNHFGMSYDPVNHFSTLNSYIKAKTDIDEYQKRLIWFFYGLCYGMHKLENKFIINSNDIFLIDNLLLYQNKGAKELVHSNSEIIVNDGGLSAIFTVVSEYGDLEDMITDMIDGKNFDKLETVLLELKTVPEDFWGFKIEWNEKDVIDYALKKKDSNYLLFKRKPDSKKILIKESFHEARLLKELSDEDKKVLSKSLASQLCGGENAY